MVIIVDDTLAEVLRFLPITRLQLYQLALINRQFFRTVLKYFCYTAPYVRFNDYRFVYRFDPENANAPEEVQIELPTGVELIGQRFPDGSVIVRREPRRNFIVEGLPKEKDADSTNLTKTTATDDIVERLAQSWQLPRFFRYGKCTFTLGKVPPSGAALAGFGHLWSNASTLITVYCTDMCALFSGGTITAFGRTLVGYRKHVILKERYRTVNSRQQLTATGPIVLSGLSLMMFGDCRRLTINTDGRVPSADALLKLFMDGRTPLQFIDVHVQRKELQRADFTANDYVRQLIHTTRLMFRERGAIIPSGRYFSRLRFILHERYDSPEEAAEIRVPNRSNSPLDLQQCLFVAGQNRCRCHWQSYHRLTPISNGTINNCVTYGETLEIVFLTEGRYFWEWSKEFLNQILLDKAESPSIERAALKKSIELSEKNNYNEANVQEFNAREDAMAEQ